MGEKIIRMYKKKLKREGMRGREDGEREGEGERGERRTKRDEKHKGDVYS